MMLVMPGVRCVSWSDFIPGLKPYQDTSEMEFLEEAGTARLGFVQLNSGSTSFNTTLNLTGPILLGLGIAAATLFYAYFNAFQDGSAYYRRKRSLSDLLTKDIPPSDLVTVLDSISIIHDLEDSLVLTGLNTPSCKMRAVCGIYRNKRMVSDVDGLSVNIVNLIEQLRKIQGGSIGSRWLLAASAGERGDECEKVYPCEVD